MNIKSTARHHGRKPTPLIYCLRSLQWQFCGTQFLILYLFLSCLENWISLFLREISQNLGPKWYCLSQPWYTVFTEAILKSQLLYCMCKNISYNFTKLAMFYLTHLCSKALHVPMMNRDWPIVFQDLFVRGQFVIVNKSQISFM